MKGLTDRIVQRFVPNAEQISDPVVRARHGLLEGWVSVVVNVALFVVKIALSVLTGSIALVADAVHTLSDVVSSAVLIVAFRVSAKPGDRRHPFGHGRAEAVGTLVLSVLLGVAAVEFMRASVARVISPRPVTADAAIIVAVALTIVVKEALARFARQLARRIDSDALAADFWHHRTDSISTALVAVGLVLDRLGWRWVDGAAGIGVAAIVGYTAVVLARNAIDPLIGEAPSGETVREIEQIARETPGVRDVHDIVVQRYGQRHFISLHVEMPADRPASDIHLVSEDVESRITDRFPGMAIVHADPVDRDHPQYDRVRTVVEELVEAHPRLASFHDLRLVGDRETFNIFLDMVVDRYLDRLREEGLRVMIGKRLRESFPRSKVTITIESPFARSRLRKH